MTTTYIDRTPELEPLIKATYPSYKGRKIKVSASERPVHVTSYWDGGSRDYFVALELATNRVMGVPQNGTPFDGGPIAPNGVPVPPGFAIVEHSIFQGKDMGLTIHVHPETMTPTLMPPKTDLTNPEIICLEATAAYKNTYAGMSNNRFREANRQTGITPEQWETAKASLTANQMLNKAGAITNKGRNALSAQGGVNLYNIRP